MPQEIDMEVLKGQSLVNKTKETVSADEALSDIDIVGIYFSAHWCPPCREFTPILAKCYKEAKEKKLPIEIIFVSSDESESDLFDYMTEAHGDWLAVPFDSPLVGQLQEMQTKLELEGIPTLLIVKKDGTVVVPDAVQDVEDKGVSAFEEWNA